MSEPQPTQFCSWCNREMMIAGKTPPGCSSLVTLCPRCYDAHVDKNAKQPLNRHGKGWPTADGERR